MRPASKFLIAAAVAVALPVADALAHGGAYRGPAGEIPPNSREPHDPPPPGEGGGPTTPGGEPGGPTTGGSDVGGPTTSGGGGGGGRGGSTGGGPSTGTGGPGGVTTPRRGSAAAGYEDWTFWWSFNKDEILGRRERPRVAPPTGTAVHAFGAFSRRDDSRRVTSARVNAQVVPVLRDLLREDGLHFDVRSAAGIALAKIGDASITPDLMAMARNADGDFHRIEEESAALALGLLGRSTDDVREFLIEIVDDTGRNAAKTRPFAAVSLGLLESDPDGRSTAALLGVIARNEKGADIKPAAFLALGLLGSPDVVPALLHAIEHGRLPTKGAADLSAVEIAFAVETLGRIGVPGVGDDQTIVADTLLKLHAGRRSVRWRDSKDVRRSTVLALGRLAEVCETESRAEIVSALRRSATGVRVDRSERAFAAVALGRIAGGSAVAPQLATEIRRDLGKLLAKGQPAFLAQPYAAIALSLSAGSGTAEEDVRKPLRDKFAGAARGDARVRSAYALASGIASDRLAVPALRAVMIDAGADKRLRGFSAVALGLIGESSAADAVRALLADESDRELRVHAAVAAGLLGDSRAVNVLIDVVRKDDSQYVLGSAALALGRIGDERAVDPLLMLATASEGNPAELTRALAVVALGQLADRGDIPRLAEVTRDLNFRAIGASPALLELSTIL